MTLYISISRAIVVNNKKNNRTDPPFEIRQSKTDTHPVTALNIPFTNPTSVRFVYDPQSPLISGAVAWVEVNGVPIP